jgi:sugar phosphate permease
MGAFSSTITYPAAGFLIARAGWREAVVVLALAHLAIALPLHVLVVRRRPEDHGMLPDGADAAAVPRVGEPAAGIALGDALRTGAFWALALAFSLGYFASTALLLEHVAYLIARGFAPATAAALVGLIGLAYIPGRLVVAYAGSRVPFALALAAAFVLEAIGVTALALRPTLAGVLVYVIAFGAAYGAISPLRGGIVAAAFGRRAYGAVMGAQGVAVALASAAAPVVTAHLIAVRGYGAAFVTCAVALLAAAAVMLPLRRLREA